MLPWVLNLIDFASINNCEMLNSRRSVPTITLTVALRELDKDQIKLQPPEHEISLTRQLTCQTHQQVQRMCETSWCQLGIDGLMVL